MEENLENLKALIRSILLALGKKATEKQFRSEYYNLEGKSFNEILNHYRMSFVQFMKSIPDVCRIYQFGDEILMERVTSQESSHMENLTIARKKKTTKFPSFRPNFGNFGHRPQSAHTPYAYRLPVRSSSYANPTRPFAGKKYPAQIPYQPLKQIILQKSTAVVSKPAVRPYIPSVSPAASRRDLPRIVFKNDDEEKDEKTKNEVKEENKDSDSSWSDDEVTSADKKCSFEIKQPATNKPTCVIQQKTENYLQVPMKQAATGKENLSPFKNNKQAKPLEYASLDWSQSIPSKQLKPLIISNPLAQLNQIKPLAPLNIPKLQEYINPSKPPAPAPLNIPKPLTQLNHIKPLAPLNIPKSQEQINPPKLPAPLNIPKPQVQLNSSKPLKTINIPKPQVQMNPSKPLAPINILKTQEQKDLPKAVASISRQPKISKLQQRLENASRSQDVSSAISKKTFMIGPYSIPRSQMIQMKLSCQIFTDVKILECSSPSQFIFQFNHEDLQNLMNEMNIFYNWFKDDENLFVKKVLPGMPVAAFENGEWNRAEILLISGSDVFVVFVDNGSRAFVKLTNIRLLEKTYAVQSRKSCKGILAGIKPAKSESLWSNEARSEFFDKTRGKKMNATIHGIKDGAYELTLYHDVMTRSKLSDHLISKGYAEPVPIEGPKNVILV